MATASEQKYDFTVPSLLAAAGTTRRRLTNMKAGKHCDHVVELQLVVAALNQLPNGTYARIEDWERNLVTFFNQDRNLQQLTSKKNTQKGVAVRRHINQERLDETQRDTIRNVRQRWNEIKNELEDFEDFKRKINDILFRRLRR